MRAPLPRARSFRRRAHPHEREDPARAPHVHFVRVERMVHGELEPAGEIADDERPTRLERLRQSRHLELVADPQAGRETGPVPSNASTPAWASARRAAPV